MPITRSELVYLAAGVAAGAVARSALPVLKEKFGPVVARTLAGAGAAFGDAYAEAARRVGETVETVQDAMAERKTSAGTSEGASAA